jgi:DNA repair exonuclease SbcCD ATPase subunit
MGHGFLCWDLRHKVVDAYHVPNDYGMVTAAKDHRGCWASSPLSDALSSVPGFPRRLTVRVAPGEDTDGLEEVLQKHDARLEGLRRHAPSSCSSASSTEDDCPPKKDLLADCNSPSAWIAYVAQNGDRDVLRRTPEWEAFFASPERLCVPMNVGALSVLQDVASRRNEAILKKIVSAASRTGVSHTCTVDLHRIDFGWMLCYGADCCFDFRMIRGRIAALAARNGSGKSAFLEIVCYALFGKGIPSRTTVANSGAAVCQMIPDNQHAYTCLRFAVQDRVYILTRYFERTSSATSGGEHLRNRKVILALAQDGAVVRQDAAVKDWIAKNVGSLEAFLHTAMITQYNDEDFFGLSARDQADRLSRALGLDATQAFAEVLKESRMGHAAAIAAGAAVVRSLAGAVKPDIPSEELEAGAARVAELRVERRRLEAEMQALREQIRGIDVSLLEEPLEDLLAGLAEAKSKAARLHLHLLKDENELLVRASQLVALGAVERKSDNATFPAPVPEPTMTERECSEALVTHRVWLERWPWRRLEDVGDVHAQHEAAEKVVDIAQTRLKEAQERQRQCLRRSAEASAALEDMYRAQGPMPEGMDVVEDDEEPPEVVLPEGIQEEEVVRRRIRERDAWRATADPSLLAMSRDELVRAHASAALDAQDACNASLEAGDDLRRCESDLEGVVQRIGGLVEAWQRRLEEAPDVPLVSQHQVAEAERGSIDDVSEAQLEEAERIEDLLRTSRADEARLAEIVRTWDANGLDFLPGCACMKHHQQVSDRDALDRARRDVETAEQELRRLLDGSKDVSELRSRVVRRRRTEFVIGQKAALEAYRKWQAICEAIKEDLEVAKRDREALEEAIDAHRLARKEADGRLAAAEGRLAALERFQEQEQEQDDGELDRARAAWDAYRRRQAWAYARCTRSKREAEEALEISLRRVEEAGLRVREAQDRLRDASEAARMADAFAVELEERMPAVREAVEQAEVARRHQEWTHAVRQAELDDIGARLRRHRDALAAQDEADLLEAVVSARPAFDLLDDTSRLIKRSEAELEDALVSLASLRERKREHDATREAHELAVVALEGLQARHDCIAHVSGLMDGFKSWLFERRVGPIVAEEVNRVLAFSDNAEVALRHRWHAVSGVLLWSIQDGPRMPPVEKAGGFQRFIVGLAMRIALARLGAADVTCNQLFIDEGFVACDAENLGRAPAFLRGLLARYGSLLLVSHLDEIRECADVKVRIERTPDGRASMLRLGQPVPVPAPKKK